MGRGAVRPASGAFLAQVNEFADIGHGGSLLQPSGTKPRSFAPPEEAGATPWQKASARCILPPSIKGIPPWSMLRTVRRQVRRLCDINLYSDTQTRPTPAMKEAMMRAEVGDEQHGDDPMCT
jgi:hypothetical protein